jgi:hypothetical protein
MQLPFTSETNVDVNTDLSYALQNDTYDNQGVEHDLYLNRTIPRSAGGMFEKCLVIANETGNVTEHRKCDSWVYDRSVFTSTLVSEVNGSCIQKHQLYISNEYSYIKLKRKHIVRSALIVLIYVLVMIYK